MADATEYDFPYLTRARQVILATLSPGSVAPSVADPSLIGPIPSTASPSLGASSASGRSYSTTGASEQRLGLGISRISFQGSPLAVPVATAAPAAAGGRPAPREGRVPSQALAQFARTEQQQIAELEALRGSIQGLLQEIQIQRGTAPSGLYVPESAAFRPPSPPVAPTPTVQTPEAEGPRDEEHVAAMLQRIQRRLPAKHVSGSGVDDLLETVLQDSRLYDAYFHAASRSASPVAATGAASMAAPSPIPAPAPAVPKPSVDVVSSTQSVQIVLPALQPGSSGFKLVVSPVDSLTASPALAQPQPQLLAAPDATHVAPPDAEVEQVVDTDSLAGDAADGGGGELDGVEETDAANDTEIEHLRRQVHELQQQASERRLKLQLAIANVRRLHSENKLLRAKLSESKPDGPAVQWRGVQYYNADTRELILRDRVLGEATPAQLRAAAREASSDVEVDSAAALRRASAWILADVLEELQLRYGCELLPAIRARWKP